MKGVNTHVRVDAQVANGRLTVALTPQGDDVVQSPRRLRGYYGGPVPAGARGEPSIWLTRRTCTFQLPDAWKLEDLHPDVLALGIAFLVFPFARSTLQVPRPVSQEFAREFEALTGLRVVPTGTIARHDADEASDVVRTGLAFSGGVDSTAAVGLLPSDTALVHGLRQRPNDFRPGRRLRTRASLAGVLEACRVMAEAGREVVIVPTDMEYLTAPVGVPTHLAFGVPALLLSGHLQLSAIAFGTIMEAAYGIGRGRFREFAPSRHWQLPESLYRAAGLRYVPVAVGLTEVGTSRVVRQLPYGYTGRSCVRGTIEPCWRCVKCFRKGLVAMAIDGHFDDTRLARALAAPQVVRELLAQPIPEANVYAWAAQRYPGSLRAIKVLRAATGDEAEDLSWMERWFPPAADLLPAVQRDSLTAAATRLVGAMSALEIEQARSFGAARSGQRAAEHAAQLRAVLLSDPVRRFRFAAHETIAAAWREARRVVLRVARRSAIVQNRR
jgi:hypothetical protein